jgi:hypothetical protein
MKEHRNIGVLILVAMFIFTAAALVQPPRMGKVRKP